MALSHTGLNIQNQIDFDAAVDRLDWKFPKQDDSKGQMYQSWDTCERYIREVIALNERFLADRVSSKILKATVPFCDTLTQCQRYLCEVNDLVRLQDLCESSFIAIGDLPDGLVKDDYTATVRSHQANMAESLGDPQTAIRLNTWLFEYRSKGLFQKRIIRRYVANNLGYCHNTANDHLTALKWFRWSDEWWLQYEEKKESVLPAWVQVNIARCMMYLGDMLEARLLLDEAIRKLTETSDWAMLA